MSVVAYHFWSATCAPCKVIKPVIEDLKEEFPQVTWISVDTHNDKEGYANKFSIHVVPTIVVIAKDASGNELYADKNSGTAVANYYRMIRNALRII